MGRNISNNRSGYNVRTKLYSSLIDNSNEIVRKIELTNAKVFYSKDHLSFSITHDEYSGVMRRVARKGLIETMDLEENEIKIYDTVEYQGILYDVEEVSFEDNNAQKEVTNRPLIKTIIKLGAVVNG